MIRSINHTFSIGHDMHGEGGVQAVMSGTGMKPGGVERSFDNARQALLWLAHQYREQAALIEMELRRTSAPSLIVPRSYT